MTQITPAIYPTKWEHPGFTFENEPTALMNRLPVENLLDLPAELLVKIVKRAFADLVVECENVKTICDVLLTCRRLNQLVPAAMRQLWVSLYKPKNLEKLAETSPTTAAGVAYLERFLLEKTSLKRFVLLRKEFKKLLGSNYRSHLPVTALHFTPFDARREALSLVSLWELAREKEQDWTGFDPPPDFSDVTTDAEKADRIRIYFQTHKAALTTSLQKLKILSSANLINIPTEISAFETLTSLDLCQNYMYRVPDHITGFSRLTKLDISQNSLTTLPPSLSKLASLTQLRCGYNRFSTIPAPLLHMSSLTSLGLSGAGIATVPEGLRALSGLKILFLEQNDIRKLPNIFGSFPDLNRLGLERNKLGTLPESIGKLRSSLEYLNVNSNSLNSFPESFILLPEKSQGLLHNPFAFLSYKMVRASRSPHVEIRVTIDELRKQFKRELRYQSRSPLALLYQQTIQPYVKSGEPVIASLEKQLNTLTVKDRYRLYYFIWKHAECFAPDQKSWGILNPTQWGKQNTFFDLDIFARATRETILEQFKDLSPEMQKEVLSRMNEDTEALYAFSVGRLFTHLSHLPLLADIIQEKKQQAAAFTVEQESTAPF